MLSYTLRRERAFYAISAVCFVLMAICLPQSLGPRAWLVFLLSLLLPLSVVGRTAQRARDGWLRQSRCARRGHRVFLAQVLSSAVLVAVFAIIAGGGEWSGTLGVFIWGMALVGVSDLTDRIVVHESRVWTRLVMLGLVVLTIPLWLAPWYGQTAWSPELATYGIGLHPSAFVLGSFGQPTLQDPMLYRMTLSGVVEVRPLWVGYGMVFYSVIGLGSFFGSAVVERRIHVDDQLSVV